MRLRNFTAPSMQEAIALVREELGPEAIIVSTDDDDGAVRVTAALEEAEPRPQRASDTDVTDQLSEALAANGVPGALSEKLLMASLTFEADDVLVALSGALAAVYSFAPIADRNGFAPAIAQTISELRLAGVTAADDPPRARLVLWRASGDRCEHRRRRGR